MNTPQKEACQYLIGLFFRMVDFSGHNWHKNGI
jgi:hypothetical protein